MSINNNEEPNFNDYLDALQPGTTVNLFEFTGYMAGRISLRSVRLRSEIDSSFIEFAEDARAAELEALKVLHGGKLPGIEALPLPDFLRWAHDDESSSQPPTPPDADAS